MNFSSKLPGKRAVTHGMGACSHGIGAMGGFEVGKCVNVSMDEFLGLVIGGSRRDEI